MAFFELTGVSKGYGAGKTRTEVLAEIDLAVEEGEFISPRPQPLPLLE